MTCAGCLDCSFDKKSKLADLHELHITVSQKEAIEFERVCKLLGIKTISVLTENLEGYFFLETMASYKLRGTDESVMKETNQLLSKLNQYHIFPVRVKLETTPENLVWLKNSGYWETHLEVIIPREKLYRLKKYVYSQPDRYLSRNISKDTKQTLTTMITVREKNMTSGQYTNALELYKNDLELLGYKSSRTIVEYCWYDTKMGTF